MFYTHFHAEIFHTTALLYRTPLSCNKEEFDKAKPLYEKSLHESGYKTSMSYAQTEVKNSRNRSRNIIWFNPPFNQNVKTNIGKLFLKLVKKHFPKHHGLHKIFNQIPLN